MSPELHATFLNLRCVLTSLLTLIVRLPARVKFLCTFHLFPFSLRTHYEITLCGGTPHFDNDILTLSPLLWGYMSPELRTLSHKPYINTHTQQKVGPGHGQHQEVSGNRRYRTLSPKPRIIILIPIQRFRIWEFELQFPCSVFACGH